MSSKLDLAAIVAEVGREVQPHRGEGHVADYIPALARVDGNRFGLAVITTDGQVFETGDAWMPFSIQSISKVFTLTLALQRHGDDIANRHINQGARCVAGFQRTLSFKSVVAGSR